MKATDLMIGNYVYVNDFSFGCSIQKVCGIEGNMVKISENVRYEDCSLSPIGLTDQILENIGIHLVGWYASFQKIKCYDIQCAPFYLEYLMDDGYYTITDHRFIKIRFFHELQNALRLCGIEKEIII